MLEIITSGETINNIVLLKLFIALGFGFIIGLEREMRRKSIGIRTCTVISVVSCLLTIVSIESANHFAVPYEKPMDPLRLTAQIVSGIGFIGAGVILRRSNNVVSGLTTAAIVWGVSGLGITIGAGFIFEAVTAVILIFIGVEILPTVLKYFGLFKMNDKEFYISIRTSEEESIDAILQKIKEEKIRIFGIKIEDDHEFIIIQIHTYIKENQKIEDVYHRLKSIRGIEKIRVE